MYHPLFVLGVLMVVLPSCGADLTPIINYSGSTLAPAKKIEEVQIYRVTPPTEPHKDLGTVSIRCPSVATGGFGRVVQTEGGCSYEEALYYIRRRVGEAGGDGLYGVQVTSVSNGLIGSMIATAFRFITATEAPAGSQPPPAPQPAPIDERLRHLRDLRDKGLITPEDYERRKAEILQGL